MNCVIISICINWCFVFDSFNVMCVTFSLAWAGSLFHQVWSNQQKFLRRSEAIEHVHSTATPKLWSYECLTWDIGDVCLLRFVQEKLKFSGFLWDRCDKATGHGRDGRLLHWEIMSLRVWRSMNSFSCLRKSNIKIRSLALEISDILRFGLMERRWWKGKRNTNIMKREIEYLSVGRPMKNL